MKKSLQKVLILRHDVDRKPNQAIKLAKIAFENDVQATFNFRVLRDRTDNAVIEIAKMGHEIGYHYEDLSIAKGDINLSIQFLKKI